MAATLCEACGQPIRHRRLGILLPPVKASLVDLIKAAGDLGISTEDIMRQLYLDRKPAGAATIKAHVWQINDQLEDTDWVIASERRRWFLRRRRARTVA